MLPQAAKETNMAIAAAGFKGTMTIVDNGRNSTTKTYSLTAATVAEALTDMAAAVAAFAAVSDAAIVGYTVQAVFEEGALSLPASGVQLEDLALITTSIVGQPLKTASFTIPAPKVTIFLGTSEEAADIVDVNDAALDTYFSLFQTNGVATISDGEAAQTIRSGRRIHRGSRKG